MGYYNQLGQLILYLLNEVSYIKRTPLNFILIFTIGLVKYQINCKQTKNKVVETHNTGNIINQDTVDKVKLSNQEVTI